MVVKDASSGVVGVGGHQGIFPKTSYNSGWVKAKVVHRGEGVAKKSLVNRGQGEAI